MVCSYLLCILLLLFVCGCYSLDVNWLPAEADGPLPLSEKYRSSLRQLCTRLADKNSQSFAEDVEKTRPNIKTMCKRLAEDDLASGTGASSAAGLDTSFAGATDQFSSKIGIVVSSALAVAILVYTLKLDQPIKKLWYSFTGRGRYTGPVHVHRGEVARSGSLSAALGREEHNRSKTETPSTNASTNASTNVTTPGAVNDMASSDPPTRGSSSGDSLGGGLGGGGELSINELREIRLRKLQTTTTSSSGSLDSS